jgi:hypothetical protein
MKTVKARELFDEPVTAAVLEQAIKRGQKREDQRLYATAVRYWPEVNSLVISFADQSAIVLPIKNYPELDELNMDELVHLSIGFGGSALCSDKRDLHVSIAGLVAASQPLMAMASTVIASRNGSRTSLAKIHSSRSNGQKGGRPRKLAML